MGILILEIGLCYLINNVLKDTLNKKIRYAICIALLLNCWNMRSKRQVICWIENHFKKIDNYIEN